MDLTTYQSLCKTVTTDHGEFEYLDVGEGPPALFVHGLFVSSYLWKDVVEQLAGERRCIAYNLPGHGHSRVASDQDLSLEAQGEMIEGFCEALGLDSLDLVANDTGGAIAQAFAVRSPQRLRTFALTNCEVRDVLPSTDPFPQLVAELASKGELAPAIVETSADPDAVRGELSLGLLHQWPERLTDDDVRGYTWPHQRSLETTRVLERFLDSLDAKDLDALEPRLRELDVPAIVVWGTDDQFFPLDLGQWICDVLPGCEELVEIDGGKLFWPFERPAELVPHLRRLWAANPAAAAA